MKMIFKALSITTGVKPAANLNKVSSMWQKVEDYLNECIQVL